MKGYPRNIATKQDFINLFADNEFRERALADLQALADKKDATVTLTLSVTKDDITGKEVAITKEITNPMPLWKVKRFVSLKDVTDLIATTSKGGI